MIDNGYLNKAIIDRLKCKPQAVYNIRYQTNKERGLGSIGTLPKLTTGIGAPPKRKYVRKARAGTGIVYEHIPKVGDNVGGLVLTEIGKGTFRWVKPTLWQRIKGWFRG